MSKVKKITPIDDVRNNLNRMEDQFKNALPSHIPPKKFIRMAMTAIQTTTSLLSATRPSLYAALIKCASDGLAPNGEEAAIIPYGKTARYMPMVKGICKKARNSGEIKSLDAIVVYENDKYKSWIDEKGAHFQHEKARKDRGEPILTYAYAITKDGGFYHEEIDESQMKEIENCSRGKDSPWKSGFKDEMRRKSALRRLAKYRLPSSADLDHTLKADDDLYDISPESTERPVRDVTKPMALKAALDVPEPEIDAEEVLEEPPKFDENEELI